GKAWNLMTLSSKISIPGDRIGEIITLLQERGLIAESGSEPPEYLLLHDPAALPIERLMRILRLPDDEQALMESRLVSVPEVDALLQRMELGMKEHLDGMTLRDLVMEQPPEAVK
ncbi:MAG TPA: hypothetical protein VGB35_06235, partial [Gammaproteobacteria bacterium]